MQTRRSKNQSKLSVFALKNYLSVLFGEDVEIRGVHRLGSTSATTVDLKGFGYGIPYVVELVVKGEGRKLVLETMRHEGFGHEHFSDRAKILIWQHSAFNRLPGHVRSLDVGAFSSNHRKMRSLGDCEEFFIITDFVEGALYHSDLDRIKETGHLRMLDERRCLALSGYLAGIHKTKHKAAGLYVRRVRELVGHNECIMGLLDSYPTGLDYVTERYLMDVERDCVTWRWRLKGGTHRLAQVHGDFHPWNVLFGGDTSFTVLDRSRGEWGEPADDVAAMTINYLFYSLQRHGELRGSFERLFRAFWEDYLHKTRDWDILNTIQPFYAWRGLVVASPVWYPNLERKIRVKLLTFVRNILKEDRFDPERANSYLED